MPQMSDATHSQRAARPESRLAVPLGEPLSAAGRSGAQGGGGTDFPACLCAGAGAAGQRDPVDMRKQIDGLALMVQARRSR